MTSNSKLCLRSHDRRDVWNANLLRWSKCEGSFEMPVLPACSVIPSKLIAFSDAKIKNADDAFIHFYEDDYKFERVWRNAKRYLPLFQAYCGTIAPDFSVYREMPLLQQMYNIFRSRVIGYWLSRNGVTVIPNARWGDKRTYNFAFDGLPHGSVIAIGTHGCVKHADDRQQFIDGFMVMLERLCPSNVIVYGSASDKVLPTLFAHNVIFTCFESDFSQSRKRMVI